MDIQSHVRNFKKSYKDRYIIDQFIQLNEKKINIENILWNNSLYK